MVFLRSCKLQRKVCAAVNLVYFFSSSEAIAVADKYYPVKPSLSLSLVNTP